MCGYWGSLPITISDILRTRSMNRTESWKRLTAEQETCRIIATICIHPMFIDTGRSGEPVYARRYRQTESGGHGHGHCPAIREAQGSNQTVITSHRSISTESTFLSSVTNMCNADCIKIGPLYTDYSSIIRLNELMRLAAPL
jgi:hypothetical protein